MCATQCISKLKIFLEQYDKVILLTGPYFLTDIGSVFEVPKKTLIISEKEMHWDVNNVEFVQLSHSEIKEIISLYHTYEFSDSFKVLSDSPHSFGAVLNLYRQGLLIEEDVLKIIFA